MKIHHLILLAFVLSCASAKKTAIKLTKKGDCEGALEHWAIAYKEDPKDEEVMDGFRHCQERVSNDRLVKIRNLRNSREEERALLEMKSLVELQTRHGMRLDYNSSSFQGKESLWLWGYNKIQLRNLIKEERPLAADYRQRKFTLVFSSLPEYSSLNSEIKSAGAVHCKSLRKGIATRPFYRSFVDQYCRYFTPDRAPGATAKIQISDVLFSTPHVDTDVDGIDAAMTAGLSKSAAEGFEHSPWFHPESKRHPMMKVNGNYYEDVQTHWINQTHEYTESVPYTVYETVTKHRQVPYQEYEEQCDIINGQRECQTNYVTKFRDEAYTEQEPHTKYRDEERFYEYKARKKRQELKLSLKGQITIDTTVHPFSFIKAESEERILHDQNVPSIGLKPAIKDVTPPTVKFEEFRSLAAVALTDELNSVWVKSFCELPQERDMASMGENVTKCRRSPKHPVEFVDKWFINNFGVTAGDAEMIIGKF